MTSNTGGFFNITVHCGWAPRDVHFARAPVSFMQFAPEYDRGTPKSIKDVVDAARSRIDDTLANDVANFLRRQEMRSPTNYSARIRVGDFALKKRTSFPMNSPKKLCHKIVVDAYEVMQRVATNSFRVKSILSGENSIVPGDHLQKVRLTRDKLIQLARELKRVTVSNRQI